MSITRHEASEIYAKVVEANGLVFTAGIVASDLSRDAKGQAAEIMGEIDRLLALAGADNSKLVNASIWLTDMRFRETVNEAWKAWLGGKNVPARATVEAKLADPRMLVEIAVVAAK